MGLLTAIGFLIAGYHPGAEDDGVYLAAIQHDLHPELFRVDADFFALQLQATIFDKVMAGFIRLTHLPVAMALLGWHLLSIFAILAACYRIVSRCFEEAYARWFGVSLLAVLLTLPVSGTALYVVDQNLHPRAIATALALFALDLILDRRYVLGFALALSAMLFHPLMGAFGLSLCFFTALPWPGDALRGTMMAAFAVPMGWIFEPTSPAWRAAVNTRNYYHLTRWSWYEWLGVIAPVLLLWWFGVIGKRLQRPVLERLAKRTAVYGTFQLAVALAMALPTALERLRPMQPMRYLHLEYVVLIAMGGCFIGEYIVRGHKWRWAAILVPAAIGMFLAQRATYPDSPHLELPGMKSSNEWVESFAWIRNNTPENAYFVLGPEYLHRPGEDCHGFRSLALRSALADNVKDSAVVTQVPRLAARWEREVAAQATHPVLGPSDWQHVTADDLNRLKSQSGVNWVVLELPSSLKLDCPYQNSRVEVCRIQ